MTSMRARGFTLIELMTVVAIIAIIAAIAYPSYAEYVARSKRANAQAALLQTAQWIERQYTYSNAYDKLASGAALNDAALPGLEAKVAAYYALSFGTTAGSSAPSAAGFSLRMVPSGAMANDRCGTFALTQTGAKTVSGIAGVTGCWDR